MLTQHSCSLCEEVAALPERVKQGHLTASSGSSSSGSSKSQERPWPLKGLVRMLLLLLLLLLN